MSSHRYAPTIPNVLTIGVFAAIFRDGKILLKKRTDGKWDLPGGSVEPDELNIIAALRREVQAEVGLYVHKICGQIGSNLPFQLPDGRLDIASCYHCEAKGEPTTSNEALEIGWFSAETLRDLPLVGPTDRLGRMGRMVYDALTIFAYKAELAEVLNIDIPVHSENYHPSTDGRFLIESFVFGTAMRYRRLDPYTESGFVQ